MQTGFFQFGLEYIKNELKLAYGHLNIICLFLIQKKLTLLINFVCYHKKCVIIKTTKGFWKEIILLVKDTERFVSLVEKLMQLRIKIKIKYKLKLFEMNIFFPNLIIFTYFYKLIKSMMERWKLREAIIDRYITKTKSIN